MKTPIQGNTVGRFAIGDLAAGNRIDTDLYDPDGVLLLAAGSLLTPEDVTLLSHRNDVFTRNPVRGNARKHSGQPARQRLDATLADPSMFRVPSKNTKARQRRVLPMSAFCGEVEGALEWCNEAAAALREIVSDIHSRRVKSAAPARELADQLVHLLAIDRDILATVSILREDSDDYLFDHSLKVAMLSMSIGDAMGLNDEQILELGAGATLMDIGMLNVPHELRLAARSLSRSEWLEIRRHPIHTIDMLDDLGGVTPGMMFIGYQCHERNDGSGYPNRRTEFVTHVYARITAIADTFAAMTADRPHRPAHTPYEAVRWLLKQGAANKFDRHIMRALLDRLSLMPIGSFVELSGGLLGRVVRPNPGRHTRPLVLLVDPDGSSQGRMIDLTRTPDVSIVRAHGLQPPVRENASVVMP